MRNILPLCLLLVLCACASLAEPPVTTIPGAATSSGVHLSAAEAPVVLTTFLAPPEDSTEAPLPEVEVPGWKDPQTIRDLCEPVDGRWGYPTKAERAHTRSVIRATCDEMGVDEDSCLYFERIVSLRESSYRAWVRHKHGGDRAAAARSYMATAHVYGWQVRWDRKAKKQEDLGAMEFAPAPRAESVNPYFTQTERWLAGGLGLGGLNIGYHLAKFDRKAPPEILCDPVVNTMVQIYLARSAVNRYGARNWIEVQAIYGGRSTYDENGHAIPETCKVYQRRGKPCPDGVRKMEKGIRKRCRDQGLDCHSRPQLGDRHPRSKTSAQDRYRVAEKVRGAPLPPFDVPQPPGS